MKPIRLNTLSNMLRFPGVCQAAKMRRQRPKRDAGALLSSNPAIHPRVVQPPAETFIQRTRKGLPPIQTFFLVLVLTLYMNKWR